MRENEALFKWLGAKGKAWHGGRGAWYLPTDGQPGRWMRPVRSELVPCSNGYHLCPAGGLTTWLAPTLWRAEGGSEMVLGSAHKVVVRTARLTERIEAWDTLCGLRLAIACADHVAHFWTDANPDDAGVPTAWQRVKDIASAYVTDGTRAERSSRVLASVIRTGPGIYDATGRARRVAPPYAAAALAAAADMVYILAGDEAQPAHLEWPPSLDRMPWSILTRVLEMGWMAADTWAWVDTHAEIAVGREGSAARVREESWQNRTLLEMLGLDDLGWPAPGAARLIGNDEGV